jgi:hypothetical protein
LGAPQLQLLVKPQEFFREKVSNAVANQNIKIGDDLEFYVVNLLCEFIAPGKLEGVAGEMNALETPLAMMLKEAMEAPPPVRMRIYKYLGDTSLYFAGFFQDYFNRKTFDIGYYIGLGSSAYDNVSTLMRDQGDEHFSTTYLGLANRFKDLVDVVAEVSETPGEARPLDILAIYDRWNRSNSERLRKMLHKVGIIPIAVPTREKQ